VKSLIVVLMLLTVIVVGIVPAHAGSAKSQRPQVDVAQLQAQVNTLKRQVLALQKTVKKVQQVAKDAANEADVNYTGDACLLALTTDAFRVTWALADQLSQQTAQRTLFGPQVAVDDKQACASLQPAVPRLATPSFAQFNLLEKWVIG
jgi:hypothetical protein